MFAFPHYLNLSFAFQSGDDIKATSFDHLEGTISLSMVIMTCWKMSDGTNNLGKSTLTELTSSLEKRSILKQGENKASMTL